MNAYFSRERLSGTQDGNIYESLGWVPVSLKNFPPSSIKISLESTHFQFRKRHTLENFNNTYDTNIVDKE